MKNNLFTYAAILATLSMTVYAPKIDARVTPNGRQLDIISSTPSGTTTIAEAPGFIANRLPVVGIFWDERCASVEYTLNSHVGANPGTIDEVTPTAIQNIVRRALARWNRNPSSYIEMNVTNVTDLGNRPAISGDFINEVTFITEPDFAALASSPSTSLTEDATFIAGEDLDGDGDSDVFDPAIEGINSCNDVDGDGDIEFPAGDYKTGTILDNDVQFSSSTVWEIRPSSNPAADIDAVSSHEFGHSQGLNHSTINQLSPTDGRTSTMFPFITTDNEEAENGTRSLHRDDLAASAFMYQIGRGDAPITQPQGDQVRFGQVYSVIRGVIENAQGDPIPGAAIQLRNASTGRVQSVSYSGKTEVLEIPGQGLFVFEESIRDARYAVPMLEARDYFVEIEALDGDPVFANNISLNAIVADILELTDFPQEDYSDGAESAIELIPAAPTRVTIGRSNVVGIDMVLNDEETQRNAGPRDFVGTGDIFGAADISYVEMFDRNEVLSRINAGQVPVAGLAETFLPGEEASVAIYDQAQIAIGHINLDGTAQITQILTERTDIVAEDSDETDIRFDGAQALPSDISAAFLADPDAQLFLVLTINDIVLGPNVGNPLGFVAIDTARSGTSFLGLNGGPLNPRTEDTWAMGLSWTAAQP